jgi:hypothetical protein
MLAYAYHFRIFGKLINSFPRFIIFIFTWNHGKYFNDILWRTDTDNHWMMWKNDYCMGWVRTFISGRGLRTLGDPALSEFAWRAHEKRRKPSAPPPPPSPLPSRLFNVILASLPEALAWIHVIYVFVLKIWNTQNLNGSRNRCCSRSVPLFLPSERRKHWGLICDADVGIFTDVLRNLCLFNLGMPLFHEFLVSVKGCVYMLLNSLGEHIYLWR